jgi:uncharacterized OB-fold protein
MEGDERMTVATDPNAEVAYNKPLPNVDGDSREQWEGFKQRKFLLFRCKTCGAWYWPKAFCRNHDNEPFFGNLEWQAASGRGKVFAFNIHHWAFHPGFKGDVPYVYALIELDEGPMFGSNVVGIDPKAVQVGMPVEVIYEDISDEYTLPKFRPIQKTD